MSKQSIKDEMIYMTLALLRRKNLSGFIIYRIESLCKHNVLEHHGYYND